MASLVTDRFGAGRSCGAVPADSWAWLRPLEALNSVIYSDLCLGAAGDSDLDLEADLDVLLQGKHVHSEQPARSLLVNL